jgi:phage shock protein C
MKKFFLSRTNKKISGVCGGIGEYIGVDATFVRVVTVLAVLMTGIFPVVIIYILIAWIAPERPDITRDVVSEQ